MSALRALSFHFCWVFSPVWWESDGRVCMHSWSLCCFFLFFLRLASPAIRLLLPRCSVGGFLCVFSSAPLTLSRIDPTHTHTHLHSQTQTDKHPGTCSHAETPHCTSAARALNLLECLSYHCVCVPTVLPASLVKMLSSPSSSILFSGISLNNHRVELVQLNKNIQLLLVFLWQKTEGGGKLHLEKSVGIQSWRFELSPRRTKMLCSRAVCWEACVGGSEVAKLLLF